MTAEYVIREYLDNLSSKQPVPGGGGASALSGALGNALAQMVIQLTLGKKKYQGVEEEMKTFLEILSGMQMDFLKLTDEDEVVFVPLAVAYGLPATTVEECAHKDSVMEERLLAASLVPIAVMEKTMELFDILQELAVKGSRLAVSDVGVAVQFARTALLGAVMNVYINTKSMKDREKAEELNCYAEKMVELGTKSADAIFEMVLNGLK